jgi:hypothetical protein
MTQTSSLAADTRFGDEHEASRISGIPVPTLRSNRTRGGGPPFLKLGRSVRYDLDELIAWMRAHRVRNTADATRQKTAREAAEEQPTDAEPRDRAARSHHNLTD